MHTHTHTARAHTLVQIHTGTWRWATCTARARMSADVSQDGELPGAVPKPPSMLSKSCVYGVARNITRGKCSKRAPYCQCTSQATDAWGHGPICTSLETTGYC